MRMRAIAADVVPWPCAPKARITSGGRFHPEIYGPAVRCKRKSNGRYGPRHDEEPHRRSLPDGAGRIAHAAHPSVRR
jgi:hypothetical protein